MGKFQKTIMATAVALAFAGCATSTQYEGDGLAVSIPYDPYDFDPDDLLAEAQAHCEAYGKKAVYEDETVDPQSVRWRYRHYRCV